MPVFMRQARLVVSLALMAVLAGCATAPPTHPNDLCAIYHEKRGWYHAAMRQEAKWNIPSSVPMAIMHQESSFRSNVHTRRTHIFWVIPWGYITTAYGYAQAKTDVWHDYERRTGVSGSRDNFADALNFMNWYITNTRQIDHIPVTDANRQYLAYHDGWGGYRRRTYASKAWLINVADKVGARARLYQRQFDRCKDDLQDGFWERFWSWL